MLLAVDVGNTQTVLGLFEGERLADTSGSRPTAAAPATSSASRSARSSTSRTVDGICLSTTVPALQREWERVAERWAQAPLLAVGPGREDGIPIRYDDPREVGPDRIVERGRGERALRRALHRRRLRHLDELRHRLDRRGVRRRRARAGIEVSMDALFARAARLVKVDFTAPATVIGKTTVGALQSGLVYGFAGQVDGIVGRIREELGVEAQTVATGGLADLIAPHARTLDRVDPHLTLEGLRIVWERNR